MPGRTGRGGAAAAPAEAKTKTKKVTLYVDSATQRSKTLKASGLKAKKASWKTSKKKLVTVSKKGKATARKKGKVTVTAKQGKNTYKFKITVKKVSISAKTLSVASGKTGNVTLVGDKIKAASTSNAAVATVSKAGVVTGVKAGTVTVTLTSKKGKKYSCKVTVTAPPEPAPVTPTDSTKPTKVAVTGVAFAQSEVTLIAPETNNTGGESYDNPAIVQPKDATDTRVTYESSDPDLVAVDEKGTITAVSLNSETERAEATITARTVEGEFVATCTVIVRHAQPGDSVFPIFSTGEALLSALRGGVSYNSVALKTENSGSIMLSGSGLQTGGVGLLVDAPNATVENYLSFGGGASLVGIGAYKEHANHMIVIGAENAQITACDGSAPQFLVKAENVTIAVDTIEEVELVSEKNVALTANQAIKLLVEKKEGEITITVPSRNERPTIRARGVKPVTVVVTYADTSEVEEIVAEPSL